MNHSTQVSDGVRSRQLRSVLSWAAAGAVILAGVSALLLSRSQQHPGLPLLIGIAAVWWAFVCAVFLGALPWLRTPDGRPVETLGVPNGLTALRAWLTYALVLAGFLPYSGREGLVWWAVLGVTVGLFDAADGFWARRWGPTTVLGKALDPASDVVFFSIGALGCWNREIIPLWLAIVIVVRYCGPLLLTPIIFVLGRRPELVHTKWGRRNTALVGGTFVVCYVVRLLGGPVNWVALGLGVAFVLPTFALHIIALVSRVKDAPSRA